MDDTAAGFADRVFNAALGYFDIASMYLGLRLGLYRTLSETPSLMAAELAANAGIAERYAREWLEQQTTRGIIVADLAGDEPRFTLPPGHAEALLDGDSLTFAGATVRQLMSIRNAIGAIEQAFRTGGGVPYDAYGEESVEGQGGG